MFAESTNRWPIWKIGGRFWLPFGRLSVREKSVADWEKSVADFACCYFSETYFLGQICYNFMGVSFTINIGLVSDYFRER